METVKQNMVTLKRNSSISFNKCVVQEKLKTQGTLERYNLISKHWPDYGLQDYGLEVGSQ